MYEDIKNVEAKFKMTPFPLNVAIEPSNYCNLNCVMCAHDKLTRKKGSMDIRLYKKIIDEVAMENPYTRIWLDFYGEPLLINYKLYYMIDYAKKKGLKSLSFNTNATMLTAEMAEMLLDSGIDFISIDCDGFSKNVFESVRVGADRDAVYENIEYFLRLKKERGVESPIIEIKIMEMDENKDELNTVIDYWRERGAWTCIRRLITWGGAVDTVHIDADKDRIACGDAVGILPITWDGIAVNCVMDVDAKYPSGDVNKESIKDIWARRNKYLVEKHLNHQWSDLPKICHGCNDWMIVGEMRFDENGDPVAKSYDTDKDMIQK